MSSARPSPRSIRLIVAMVLAIAVASPAMAITNGMPDGGDHPFVGSIVVSIPERPDLPPLLQWCSGTLIARTVFLTASHCTADFDALTEQFPMMTVSVTFDPVIDDQATLHPAEWHTNPGYNGFSGKGGASDPGDIAVMTFADPIQGITPARLPEAGLLDELKDDGLLRETRFTAVGYGTVRDDNHAGWQGILDNLDRNQAEQGFHSLTKAWLTLPMTPSNGNGGTCYGDSGGPHFIHLDGAETDIVVSLTVTGDAQCKASDRTYRTDTESARAFLDDFVVLP